MAKSVREEFKVPGLNPAISHYTDAVRFGNLLLISGLAPLDEDMNLIGGDDAAAQTRQIFVNMERILEAAGADFGDVLRVTVYLTDIKDLGIINPVREEYFGDTRPASTAIGINELAVPGMKVEIEAIVGLPG